VERYVMFWLVLLAYSTHHRIRNVVNAGVMYQRLALVAAAAMIAPAPTRGLGMCGVGGVTDSSVVVPNRD
jgi:hypothetical protein